MRSSPGPENVGIVVQGGLYNGLMHALRTLGLADAFGASRLPILALNVVYPAGAGGDRRLLPGTRKPFWSWRKASRNSSSRRSPPSCGAPTSRRSCTARTSCTWRASTTSRRWCAALPSSSACTRLTWTPIAGSRVVEIRPEHQGEGHGIPRRAAGAAADVLRRLPGAPGVLGDEAGGAGHRPAARLDGRRLPCVRELRAVLAGQYAARLRHEPRRRGRRRTRCRRSARWR